MMLLSIAIAVTFSHAPENISSTTTSSTFVRLSSLNIPDCAIQQLSFDTCPRIRNMFFHSVVSYVCLLVELKSSFRVSFGMEYSILGYM